jgi:hypothetical protein
MGTTSQNELIRQCADRRQKSKLIFHLQICADPCYVWCMDVISLGFYAIVCGTLAAAGPTLGGIFTRVLAGAAVGFAAAWALPLMRGVTGY